MTIPAVEQARLEQAELQVAMVNAQLRRVAVLLDALAHVLNTVADVMPAVTAAFDAAGVQGERWPDGGITEPWLRGELEAAGQSLNKAATAWGLLLVREAMN